ncbi:MAG TPA: helix-turn-helix domain-containing protein [Candidatus Limnocylindrales bacterium]
MPAPVARAARQPLIVIEGPPGTAERAASSLRAAGFDVVAGFRVPIVSDRAPSTPPIVCSGAVADGAGASEALLAAIAGAGILVDAIADRVTVDRLVDDLRRVGPVDHRIVTTQTADPVVSPESRAILGLLAEGHSLGEAAAALGLSRRTADRRLHEARDALGVARTTEAIARAASLGLLGTTNG